MKKKSERRKRNEEKEQKKKKRRDNIWRKSIFLKEKCQYLLTLNKWRKEKKHFWHHVWTRDFITYILYIFEYIYHQIYIFQRASFSWMSKWMEWSWMWSRDERKPKLTWIWKENGMKRITEWNELKIRKLIII